MCGAVLRRCLAVLLKSTRCTGEGLACLVDWQPNICCSGDGFGVPHLHGFIPHGHNENFLEMVLSVPRTFVTAKS